MEKSTDRTTPMGMKFVENALIIDDIDRLGLFSRRSAKKLFAWARSW